jgi:coproporphyrinogen III oxidase-like Fe-S oxidoreductase
MIEGDDAEFEKIMLALRTTDGLKVQEFDKEFNVQFAEKYKKPLTKKSAYLDFDGKTLKIKDEYLYVQNDVIMAFMETN